MRVSSCILVSVLAAAACHPAWPPPEVEFGSAETLDAYLQTYLDAPGGPPSISVAISVDGEIVVARAIGWADEEAREPATSSTAYRTYSISKAITAIAVMQLVEAGALDLEDPIRRYVPALPESYRSVTLRQLLTHTSGVRHYAANAGEISSQIEYASLEESLVVFADDPLEFEPGSAYGYTSFGFNLLTGAIQAASRSAFGDYLETRVFEPAGAEHSGLAIAGRVERDLATAYWPPATRVTANRPIEDLPNVSGRYGSSGVVSTPSDLVRILIALERGSLLAPETLHEMISPAVPEIDPELALGWNLDGDGCRRQVYRSGAGTGYTGLLIHYPELRIGGAVLVNQNQWQGRAPLLEGILDHYVERLAPERCG